MFMYVIYMGWRKLEITQGYVLPKMSLIWRFSRRSKAWGWMSMGGGQYRVSQYNREHKANSVEYN